MATEAMNERRYLETVRSAVEMVKHRLNTMAQSAESLNRTYFSHASTLARLEMEALDIGAGTAANVLQGISMDIGLRLQELRKQERMEKQNAARD